MPQFNFKAVDERDAPLAGRDGCDREFIARPRNRFINVNVAEVLEREVVQKKVVRLPAAGDLVPLGTQGGNA